MNDYREQIEKDGVLAFTPRGNSMWPFIKNGKTTVIVLKKEKRAEKYDVIFYRRGQTYVFHRVLDVSQDGYIACGDSLLQKEEVKEDAVFGVMKGFYRGKKYIDAKDPGYIEKVKKYYDNPLKRRRKIKAFYLRLRIKNLFIGE